MPQPFIIFAIVLVVIWTLSGLATWANKQKEAERRARLRDQLARAAGQPPGISQRAPQASRVQQRAAQAARTGQQRAPQPSISEGLAQRFPDVLLPPMPQVRRPQVRAPRPLVKKGQRQGKPARQVAALPPPLESAPVQVPPPVLAEAPPAPKSRSASNAAPRINAAMLSRWMTPATLNQQFLLTEILQPPLAMREQR